MRNVHWWQWQFILNWFLNACPRPKRAFSHVFLRIRPHVFIYMHPCGHQRGGPTGWARFPFFTPPALTETLNAPDLKVSSLCSEFHLNKWFAAANTNIKKQWEQNRLIRSLTVLFFPDSGSLWPSCLPPHSAHKSAMATGGKKTRKKKEKIWQHGALLSLRKVSPERHTARALWTSLAACRPSRPDVGLAGRLLDTSGRTNSRQKAEKECDGVRAITRLTNQSSQTGWRSKRLWKKR